MKPRFTPFVLGLLLSIGAGAAYAEAQVEVRYIEPEKFSAMKSTWLTQENMLATLTAHLQTLGQKYLSAGQTLQIEITDIVLAGSIEYPRNGEPIRVMREVTPPRISLRWRVSSADKSAPMHEATLIDASYLTRINQHHDGDPLRYEKRLLEDWFKRSVVAKAK